jgi:hypothetical protein
LPQRSPARVGIKGVHGVILSCDIDDVVGAAANGHAGDVQRLGVDLPVDRVRKEFAESRGVDVGGSQQRLARILSRALIVVVVGVDPAQ